MIKINGQNISLTRGDYASLVFSAYEEGYTELCSLYKDDKVVFQLGKKYGSPIFTKAKVKENNEATTEADYTISISPEDTKELKNGGVYYYDVAIVRGNQVFTYIGDDDTNKPTFKLLNEVGGENDNEQ